MLEKKYNHKQVEEGKYENWLKHNYFKAGDLTKEAFSIVIPPPNVTGKLHLGHAWDTTLQDIIIRYKKMDGYDALWLPGMDHAAIATEVKVVERLKENGINKRDLGREGFLKKALEWKDEYAKTIRQQWGKLGLALDYSKERFTLDDGMAKAVKKVFVDYYNEGIIYRGERIINWDPVQKTALSNEEVIYKDVEGAFYHIKYFIEGTNDYLEVATTRPETLFGDTAVAVNPKDERYNKLIGKNVILPIVNKLIPIIGDEHADPTFGTGVVKITPAHDPNDFEVGKRHNLPFVVVMNEDATMNDNAGIYKGMDRFLCRQKLVSDLKDAGLLIKVKKMMHSVGHSERTGVMIEPYLSKQWFVKMDELSKKVLENQKDKDNKINFVPKRFEKILNNWMSNCHDWCISRQLWWGHRIPAWYKDDKVYVGLDAPKGSGWHQDEDVLDTWFSSALWPFATLGWPDNTDDLKRYFPNDVLVTGYDIIFFWVCRMAFESLKLTGKRPFKDCLIHGLIRDKTGRKMSKSLGNGVDPMDVIDEYGADSLRWFLTTNSAPGQDLRYDEDKVKATWNFINKIWNASRFVLMNTEGLKKYDLSSLTTSDKWILTKLNKTIKEVRKNMEKYDFNVVGAILYKFIWDNFCDNYIEYSKVSINNISTKSTLIIVLTSILKMLHPFMPYVTDEIYDKLPIKECENIILSTYPKHDKNLVFKKEEEEIDALENVIATLRNVKKENDLPKGFKLINNFKDEYKYIIDNNKDVLTRLLKCDIILSSNEEMTKIDVSFAYGTLTVLYVGVSKKDNKELLLKQKDSLEKSIERREKLLSNTGYVNNAPEKIVSEERKKLSEEKSELKEILDKLK